nr:TrbG/VirB9 family P-type conjugative transfer protein [uncultured Brevundimonas sp.]
MSRLILVFLLLATTAEAQTPAPPAGDPRLQAIPYDDRQVVKLKAATNFQTTILFHPEERVENVAIGDGDVWQITLNKRNDALFIKPLRASGVTNLTVITDVRVYNFELSASFGQAGDTPYTVRFLYPGPSAPGAQAPIYQGVGRYRLSGPRSVRPREMSDDGTRTFIEWRPQQAIPAVFAIDETGTEILVDGHMRNGVYVIDAVHRALRFRLGNQSASATRLNTRAAR